MAKMQSSRDRRLAANIDSVLAALEEDIQVSDEIEEDLPEDALVGEDDECEVEADVNLDKQDIEDLDLEDLNDWKLSEDEEIEIAEDDEECEIAEDDDFEVEADDFMDDPEALNASKKEAKAEKKASEVEKGVEDEIKDTATGGDPTVQEVVPGGKDAKNSVEKDSEVFPTSCEYVAKVTGRLDKIASYLEKTGRKKLALRLDKVSDYLETQVKK